MKALKLFTLSIAFLAASNAFGQTANVKPMSFDQLGTQWSDYEKREMDKNFLSLYSRQYKDTVSVEEMKQAFYDNRNAEAKDKEIRYEDFLVIKPQLHPDDIYLRVYPTLKDHPEKQVDEGMEITLSNPKWYMGFIVSPRAYFEVYNRGERTVFAPYATYSDFFAYAAYRPVLQLDGPYNWHQDTGWGARLIGTLHTMRTAKHWGLKGEKQFSVLLYTKTYPRSHWVSYSLELLESQKPDEETQKLFEDLKKFVERIPSKAFAPYFTTDLRLVKGRYYRVTVNKCGWLIEDYLNLN
jgi:hypothetical protein